MLFTPVVVLFFLKAENNFCHFDMGGAATVAEVLGDDEPVVVADVVGVEVVVGGVEKVTLCVDGDPGGCWSRCCCCCCREWW